MIDIKYNQNVIAKLREEGFFPDTMFSSVFAMQCVANNQIVLLDNLDDYSTSKRMILVYMDLVRRRLFVETEKESPTYYALTDQGMALLNALTDMSSGKVTDDTDEWIKSWIELFPKGIKSGGKLLRSDAKSCLIKMKKFRREYPEFATQDLIFKATKKYLTQQEAKGWEYTRCAIYFIFKQEEGSDLAAYCSDLLSPASKEERLETVVHRNNTGLV